jgi:hypothetical protein
VAELRATSGEIAGRHVSHVLDAQGRAVPVSAATPLPTTAVPAPATWSALSAAASGTVATATRAGEAGKSHHITTVLASFSGEARAKLTVKDGAAVIAEHYVLSHAVIPLPSPRKAAAGNAVSAELAAGGLGITGSVTLLGFTS